MYVALYICMINKLKNIFMVLVCSLSFQYCGRALETPDVGSPYQSVNPNIPDPGSEFTLFSVIDLEKVNMNNDEVSIQWRYPDVDDSFVQHYEVTHMYTTEKYERDDDGNLKLMQKSHQNTFYTSGLSMDLVVNDTMISASVGVVSVSVQGDESSESMILLF